MKFILELVRSIGERFGGIVETDSLYIFFLSQKPCEIYMVTRKWYVCFGFLDKGVLQRRTSRKKSKISPISYQILLYFSS